MEILIEEIARVALGMVFDEIGHELDVSDEELLQVRDYLEAKLQEENKRWSMREELEGMLEIVRLTIAKQGRIVDARLLEKERNLEQAIKNLEVRQ